MTTCRAALNIAGGHFPCRQMEQMAPGAENHDGWAHSNPDAEAIWTEDAGPGCAHCHDDPPKGHTCPRCGRS